MFLEQRRWTPESRWQLVPSPGQPGPVRGAPAAAPAELVLVFGGRAVLRPDVLDPLAREYPGAALVGCSTAGEILGTHVADDSVAATAIRFAPGSGSRVKCHWIDLRPGEDSGAAGYRLVSAVAKEGLRHVLVLCDGQHVNGSGLVAGMRRGLPAGVQVTGGLAGDGSRFQHTLTLAGGAAREDRIAAVAFYGPALRVGYGSLGGWDAFGPQRRVTRSAGNVLYELDGQPALALYKRYLGEHVQGLPATGLLFPLAIQAEAGAPELVRTILGVSEADQSLTFAGDIPQGSMARLMKANFDRLVEGAHGAAEASAAGLGPAGQAQLAILISCVGRKLVLKQRTEEELEAVQEVLGPQATMTGFYSYGEICPAAPQANCELHNQTMTITTLREA